VILAVGRKPNAVATPWRHSPIQGGAKTTKIRLGDVIASRVSLRDAVRWIARGLGGSLATDDFHFVASIPKPLGTNPAEVSRLVIVTL